LDLAVDDKWLAASGLAPDCRGTDQNQPDAASREFRLLLAAKLFELGRVTLAQRA
jgi:hypothetical protein